MTQRQPLTTFASRTFVFGSKSKDKSLYEVLGVSEDASQADVKRAFLEMAKKHHPDRNNSQESTRIFAEINEAYETLGDQSKRDIYDATGMSSNEQQNADQQGGPGFGFNPFGFK